MMAVFRCEHCGRVIYQIGDNQMTACEHYPLDRERLGCFADCKRGLCPRFAWCEELWGDDDE